MNDYNSRVYWNNKTYGKSIKVPTSKLTTSFYGILALIVPILVPLPLIPVVYSYMKRYDFVYRYGK